MDPDARVTAAEVEFLTTPKPAGKPTITRHLVYMWRSAGLLVERGKRGRSPLYRWGDVVEVDKRQARAAIWANNHRARRVA